MELKDKVVVITGGTKGLGRAMALRFLKSGAKVLVCSHQKKDLKNLESGILGIKADVTKEKEMQKLARFALKKFGRIDIWINNAGIWLPYNSAENFDMDRVRKIYEVNVFGVMNGSRVALRLFKEQGAGSIVNIISDAALANKPMRSMYTSSKWAANGFTRCIREENKDISIFSIYPGGMKTELFGQNKPEKFDTFLEPDFVAGKIVENLQKENPETELIIRQLG